MCGLFGFLREVLGEGGCLCGDALAARGSDDAYVWFGLERLDSRPKPRSEDQCSWIDLRSPFLRGGMGEKEMRVRT